jgi:hypothetical protein
MIANKGFRKQKTGELFKNLTFTGTVEKSGELSNYFMEDFISIVHF